MRATPKRGQTRFSKIGSSAKRVDQSSHASWVKVSDIQQTDGCSCGAILESEFRKSVPESLAGWARLTVFSLI